MFRFSFRLPVNALFFGNVVLLIVFVFCLNFTFNLGSTMTQKRDLPKHIWERMSKPLGDKVANLNELLFLKKI